MRTVNRDAKGRIINTGDRWSLEPAVGATVQITLDRNIQHFTEQSLRSGCESFRAKRGAAAVLEAGTGRILAMASYPGFNPNEFTRYSQGDFRNLVVGFIYEPGSTFKIITVSAALEESVFDEMEILFCGNGRFEVADRVINDHTPHGWLTLMGIVKNSSNIGASKVGLELGSERLGRYALDFGFGNRVGLLLPGENKGLLSDPSRWTEVDLATISFGQGIAVTPLQMAAAVNVLATGGDLIRPYLVERITTSDGKVIMQKKPEIIRRVISRDTAGKVSRMMETVVGPGGSGARAAIEGYRIAGKTGTAQKYSAKEGRYSEDAFVASFVGFAPADDPVVTAIVVMDEPFTESYGGVVAAPVWADFMEKTLKYLQVQPELEKQEEQKMSIQPILKTASRHAGDDETSLPVMPDLRGLTLREAMEHLSIMGCGIIVNGEGVVVKQKPAPGEEIGGQIDLDLEPRAAVRVGCLRPAAGLIHS